MRCKAKVSPCTAVASVVNSVARQGQALRVLRSLDPMATEVRQQKSERLKKKALTG